MRTRLRANERIAKPSAPLKVYLTQAQRPGGQSGPKDPSFGRDEKSTLGGGGVKWLSAKVCESKNSPKRSARPGATEPFWQFAAPASRFAGTAAG